MKNKFIMFNILLVIIGSIVYGFLPIFVKNIIPYNYSSILILMTLIYKEKINLLKILSALSSIIGIFLLTKIAAIESFNGIIYALLTTITYGIYIIANKKSSFASLDTMVSLFYMSLIVSVVFFIAGILTNSLQLLNNIFVFYNFVAISILCTIFSLGLLLYGVKQLGSSLASILNMFEPTTTVIVSALIYDEKLTINIIIGSILIILSTVFIILSSNSNNK